MNYAIESDIGREKKRAGGVNEDSATVVTVEDVHRDQKSSSAILVIADGAGGHDAGEVASYIGVRTVSKLLMSTVRNLSLRGRNIDSGCISELKEISEEEISDQLIDAIHQAHEQILRYSRENNNSAFTTIIAGIYHRDTLYYAWVGDSRIYIINEKNRSIDQLTKDHSKVEKLISRNEIDPVEALVHPDRNVITRAIGGFGNEDQGRENTVEVDTGSVSISKDDIVLLTSDGLVDAYTDAHALYEKYMEAGEAGKSDVIAQQIRDNSITDEEVLDIILKSDTIDKAAKKLISLANERGGKDNISNILFRDQRMSERPEN